MRRPSKYCWSPVQRFERALALDPFDAFLLELRASQFELLAVAAEKLGDQQVARHRIA